MKPQNISFKHLFKDVRRKSILQTILFFSFKITGKEKNLGKITEGNILRYSFNGNGSFMCVILLVFQSSLASKF